MSEAQSLHILKQLVQRESRSLMQYTAGVFPWTSAGHAEAGGRLRAIIFAERDHLINLTRFLSRHRMPPPHSGGYPIDFTSLNFIGLGHLASLLLKHQYEAIAEIEADLAALTDPEGRKLAEKFLALKKQHLDDLRGLQHEPAVTS